MMGNRGVGAHLNKDSKLSTTVLKNGPIEYVNHPKIQMLALLHHL